MRLILLAFIFVLTSKVNAQNVCNSDSIGLNTSSENTYNKALFGDSLSSSFCIVIKKEVKPHKHVYHSEQVIVLNGEAMMKLDGKSFAIRKGDVVFIPRGAVHSVKVSNGPLKIISVQSPRFDGSDRVMVEEK